MLAILGHMYMYSGTSLIRTPTIRLLALSGIDFFDILINAHAARAINVCTSHANCCSRAQERKREVLT